MDINAQQNSEPTFAQASSFNINVILPYQLTITITINNEYTTSDLLQDLYNRGSIDCNQYAVFFNNTRLGVEDILIEKGVKGNCNPLHVVSDDLFLNTQPTQDDKFAFDIDDDEEKREKEEDINENETESEDGDSSEDEIDANIEYIRNGDFDKVKPFNVVINIFDQIAVMEINKTTTMKDVLDWLVRNNRKFFSYDFYMLFIINRIH